jgi:hypothetical protein
LLNACGKVSPAWIHGFHERDFLLSYPSLYLLFACNRVMYTRVFFPIDLPRGVVALREALNQFLLVLPNALFEIAGYACIRAYETCCS